MVLFSPIEFPISTLANNAATRLDVVDTHVKWLALNWTMNDTRRVLGFLDKPSNSAVVSLRIYNSKAHDRSEVIII